LSSRFKEKNDRGAIEVIMAVFLPILHSRASSWVKDDSLDSYLLVTKVFKIFRGLIQVLFLLFKKGYIWNIFSYILSIFTCHLYFNILL